MATKNSTRSTSAIRLDPATTVEINEMALRLNKFGSLLKGVGEICNTEEIGGDALYVAAVTCDQINRDVCEMADRLNALAAEGGAA